MRGVRVATAGVVTPAGIGTSAFLDALGDGGFPWATTRAGGDEYRISCLEDLPELAANRLEGLDTRRVDRTGVLALLAAQEALGAARPPLGHRTALVLASAHGALGFSEEYHRGVFRRGAAGLSALLFSSSLLSSAAGTLALACGIRGPVHTLSAGATAAADALDLGALLLESGEADRVLVVAAEMFHPLYPAGYRGLLRLHGRFGRTTAGSGPAFSEGATALLLDMEERGGMGRVLGASGTLTGESWTRPLAPRLESAWGLAGLRPAESDLFLPGANGSFLDRLEADALAVAGGKPGGAVLALKRVLGEGFAHTSLLQVAAALLLLDPGQKALAQGIHFDGAVGAVALEKEAP